MPARSYTAADAECRVYTFKEGVLAAIAHDLLLKVEQFDLRIDEEARLIEASFDAASLRVVTAMKDGREAPALLGRQNFSKIENSITDEVLHSRKHPFVRFRSHRLERHSGGYRIVGELELHGTRREIAVEARHDGAAWTTELWIHQPDFGIRPFTAMLGTLRIKPSVKVVLRVPAEQAPV